METRSEQEVPARSNPLSLSSSSGEMDDVLDRFRLLQLAGNVHGRVRRILVSVNSPKIDNFMRLLKYFARAFRSRQPAVVLAFRLLRKSAPDVGVVTGE